MPREYLQNQRAEIVQLQQQNERLIAEHAREKHRLEQALSESQNQLTNMIAGHTAERQALQQDIKDLKKYLKDRFENQSATLIHQIETFLTLQAYLNTGNMLGTMVGWPISPDFGLYLIEILEHKKYDAILEFGSGISTLVVAKALKKKSERTGIKNATHHLALDHLAKYWEKTGKLLAINGLEQDVDLRLAPFVPFIDADKQKYAYYQCHDAIRDIKKRLKDENSNLLLIVDGPPGTTNQHARYPALPIVLEHHHGANIDIVMDDYIRTDEKEISQKWFDLLKSKGYFLTTSEVELHKGALFIQATQTPPPAASADLTAPPAKYP